MKAFEFGKNVTHSQREVEATAYREFIDLTQAIICEYKLDLCVRSEASCEDSVARGRFISGLIGLYIDKREASWPAFLATQMDVTEDNRGIYLRAGSKNAIIGVVNTIKTYAEGTGFTFTL